MSRLHLIAKMPLFVGVARSPGLAVTLRWTRRSPTVVEIIAVKRAARIALTAYARPGLIALPWRTGIRLDERLSMAKRNPDPPRAASWLSFGDDGKRRCQHASLTARNGRW